LTQRAVRKGFPLHAAQAVPIGIVGVAEDVTRVDVQGLHVRLLRSQARFADVLHLVALQTAVRVVAPVPLLVLGSSAAAEVAALFNHHVIFNFHNAV